MWNIFCNCGGSLNHYVARKPKSRDWYHSKHFLLTKSKQKNSDHYIQWSCLNNSCFCDILLVQRMLKWSLKYQHLFLKVSKTYCTVSQCHLWVITRAHNAYWFKTVSSCKSHKLQNLGKLKATESLSILKKVCRIIFPLRSSLEQCKPAFSLKFLFTKSKAEYLNFYSKHFNVFITKF